MSSTIEAIRSMLVTAAHRAYQRGIQTGSGGNLSARIPGQHTMLIKPREISLIDLSADTFIVTDFDGRVLEGQGKPTKEAYLHGLLYRLMPDVDAIVHCHAPWSVAWSLQRDDIPLVTHHAKLKLQAPIPVLAIDSPVVTTAHESVIADVVAAQPNLSGFVLAAHGIVALGKDAIAAEHNAQLIEETAQIACMRQWLAASERGGDT